MDSASLFTGGTPRRKRVCRREGNNASMLIGANEPECVFQLPAEKLSQWLICPPCRLHETFPFNNDDASCATDTLGCSTTSLKYAIIPGFFACTLLKGTEMPLQASRNVVCKSPLRQILMQALGAARHSMGAVDDIPKDSLLVAGFATTSQSRRLKDRSSFSTNAVGRSRQKCELVALCVAGELTGAYRMHAERVTKTDKFALPYEQGKERWELKATRVGDTWYRGSSFCGVQFFWVQESYRRCGIGKQLVELARRNVSYGFEIPQEHVAFSEPTALGKLFARSYTKRTDFLIF